MSYEQTFGLLHGSLEDSYRVNLSGEFDMASVDATDRAVDGFRRSTVRDVLVDAAEVTFMDSTGAGFLLELSRTTRARRGRLVVLDPDPGVLRLLTLTEIAERVDVDRRRSA